MTLPVLHVRGIGLPDEQPVEWWIAGGVLSAEPVSGAETVFGADGYGGWILPGLVDAHCHVGLGDHGPLDNLDDCIEQAAIERDPVHLLVRAEGQLHTPPGESDRTQGTSPGPIRDRPAAGLHRRHVVEMHG